MTTDTDKELKQLRRRLRDLEQLKEWLTQALEIGAGLADFKSGVNNGADRETIFTEIRSRLFQLFNFHVISILTVDESNHEFVLADCVPDRWIDYIQTEVDHLIDSGTFAWAIEHDRALVVATRDEKHTLIMHVIATRARVRGMFIGILDQDAGDLQNASLSMLSMIIGNAASALETYEMYKYVNEQNRNLEQIVVQRTEQLEVARAQAELANRAKGEFLANMSHEIRTPLTSVIGYADLLRTEDLDERAREQAVDTICRTGRHVIAVINDVLDLSKIESDAIVVERMSVSPCELLADVKSIIAPQANAKKLEFNVECSFPLPRKIATDPTRLKQILLNLCGNAVKFTDRGGVHMLIAYHTDRGQIAFTIEDTGRGIDEEKQRTLFRRFSQGDSSTTRQYGGSGLGLYISKRFAELLGGTIEVRSQVNKGSCFAVTVEAGEQDEADFIRDAGELERITATHTETASGDDSMRLSGKVLLAEDNPDNQRLISYYLQTLGLSVHAVDDGQAAVETALSGAYDLILMDIQMPGMDGLEATAWLKQFGYGRPVIALSANAAQEDKQACSSAGFDGFLSKPIDRDAFRDLLARHLPVATQSVGDEQRPIASRDELAPIREQFVRELPNRIAEMTDANRYRSWDELRFLAHRLKGAAAGFGYHRLGTVLGMMEADLRARKTGRIERLLVLADLLCRRATAERHPNGGPNSDGTIRGTPS